MKIQYAARVIFLSFEMIIVMASWLLISNFETQATNLAHLLNINEEIVKYLMLLPMAICAWTIKEAKDLVFSEVKQLVNWPDYWRIKIHIYTCFFYAAIFFSMSVIPWLSKTGISDGRGLILFSSGVAGCMWVAGSIYFAQMSVKEIINIEYSL